MSTNRIYCVTDCAKQYGGKQTFVKAATQAQALRHVAKHRYTVEVATALEVAEYMQDGLTIEDATGPQAELPIDTQP